MTLIKHHEAQNSQKFWVLCLYCI